MVVAEAAEFFYIGIWKHVHQKLVIGVSAGIFTAEFGDINHRNLSAHFCPEFRLGRGCPVKQDRSVGFKQCLDPAFTEKVYGFLTQQIWNCAEIEQLIIHVDVCAAAVYIAIKWKVCDFRWHHGFGTAGIDEKEMSIFVGFGEGKFCAFRNLERMWGEQRAVYVKE